MYVCINWLYIVCDAILKFEMHWFALYSGVFSTSLSVCFFLLLPSSSSCFLTVLTLVCIWVFVSVRLFVTVFVCLSFCICFLVSTDSDKFIIHVGGQLWWACGFSFTGSPFMSSISALWLYLFLCLSVRRQINMIDWLINFSRGVLILEAYIQNWSLRIRMMKTPEQKTLEWKIRERIRTIF